MLAYLLEGYRDWSPRRAADRRRHRRRPWPVAEMVRQASPHALLLDHGLVLPRLVSQHLLTPALLAAESLVTSVHVHVLVGAELPQAEGAGPQEAAARPTAVPRRRRRQDHLLQDDVRVRRRPRVVVVLDQDLQPNAGVVDGVSLSPVPPMV